jgi:peptidoglycan hydrolase CwlO-like protein
MMRNVVIVLLIAVISIMFFKVFDRKAGAQENNELSQVLENQKLILEKLSVMDHKLDVLKTRLY